MGWQGHAGDVAQWYSVWIACVALHTTGKEEKKAGFRHAEYVIHTEHIYEWNKYYREPRVILKSKNRAI